MDKYQLEVLGNWTCDYPEGKTFDEVMDLIENESDEVTIWQPFEDWPGHDIVKEIIGQVNNLKRNFK